MELAHAITPAIAKEFQLKSAAARKENRRLRKLAEQSEKLAAELAKEQAAKLPSDPYVETLMRAQIVTLDDYLACPIPKDRASLAQALKNLRETYHLATGLAKPGVRKPERVNTRQQPSQQSSGPELPPDTTSGSGSTGQ